MENNETYNWAPNDPGKNRNKPSLKKVGSKVLVFVLVMLLVGGGVVLVGLTLYLVGSMKHQQA